MIYSICALIATAAGARARVRHACARVPIVHYKIMYKNRKHVLGYFTLFLQNSNESLM